jgi:CelD/BcsL family acetyltransferase involved in cellulose biosynthesis
MSQISIEKVSAENSFDLLREEWKQLFNAISVSPFLSWEWLSVWHKWFGQERTPFILKAYRDDKLIGLLPLCIQEKKIFGLKLKRIGFMGEEVGGADYLDLISKPDDKTEILSAIFDFLKKENLFDLISLESLESSSGTINFLRELENQKAKEKLRFAAQTTEICPKINLSDSWETILKQSKRASNYKRRLKQLEKLQGFEFRSVTSPSETRAAFERFYQLHEKRWQKDGGSELSGHPRLVSFQRDLVRELSRTGLLRFDELWADGECRASVYGLDSGETFYYYNSGYDLEWSKHSVGLVLIGLSIKSAIERGNKVYDFLRGEEIYKFDWANYQTELVTVNLSRRTFPAFVFQAKNRAWVTMRDFSKNALPTNLVNQLKMTRREWKREYRLTEITTKKTQEIA